MSGANFNHDSLVAWAHAFPTTPEQGEKDIFTTKSPLWNPIWGRGVFGGVLLAQSLAAAQNTVPGHLVVHSLHGSFILAAKNTLPITYQVERLRDGKSIASRLVKASQEGQCVFTATISFFLRKPPAGRETIEHQADMPKEILESGPPSKTEEDVHTDSLAVAGQTAYGSLYECIRLPPVPSDKGPEYHRLRHWVRSCRKRQNNKKKTEFPLTAHLAALTYMTDSYFIGTVARVHGAKRFNNTQAIDPIKRTLGTSPSQYEVLSRSFDNLADEEAGEFSTLSSTTPEKGRRNIELMVSLSHSIYFHNQTSIKADEWMFTEMETPWAGDERGLVVQRVWTSDGVLVATCYQEGLIRISRKKSQNKL